jgi:hypothetical protein
LNWHSPTGLFFIGVAVTVVLTAVVILALLLTGNPLSDNASLIAAVVALVVSAQPKSSVLDLTSAARSMRLCKPIWPRWRNCFLIKASTKRKPTSTQYE